MRCPPVHEPEHCRNASGISDAAQLPENDSLFVIAAESTTRVFVANSAKRVFATKSAKRVLARSGA
jgi:hypothetical protein